MVRKRFVGFMMTCSYISVKQVGVQNNIGSGEHDAAQLARALFETAVNNDNDRRSQPG